MLLIEGEKRRVRPAQHDLGVQHCLPPVDHFVVLIRLQHDMSHMPRSDFVPCAGCAVDTARTGLYTCVHGCYSSAVTMSAMMRRLRIAASSALTLTSRKFGSVSS